MSHIPASAINHRALRAGLAAALLALAWPAAAQAPLVPADFFASLPDTTEGAAAVEADTLIYNANTAEIIAEGRVILGFAGYEARADRLVFNQRTGDVTLSGPVFLRHPDGTTLQSDGLAVTGALRQAVLRAMTITTPDGAVITADDVRYTEALETVLVDARYSPCGTCIDDKGRRIGWQVRAARIIHDAEGRQTVIEHAVLEILGAPVAWVPYLWLPDISEPGFIENFRMPTLASDERTGWRLRAPYSVYADDATTLVVTPTLMSRQGAQLGVDVTRRFTRGEIAVSASGLYQMDRDAFAGRVGDLDWRGAIQTSGRFTPIDQWTVGWSYTAFTDPAYFSDYGVPAGPASTNEVYVEHLSRDNYLNVRLQQFNLLGEVTQAQQDRQGSALPNASWENVTELGNGLGQLRVSGNLLGTERIADHATTLNAVDFVFGHAGSAMHGTLEAGWQSRWIVPGGLVASPYLGVRADAASYDGASTRADAPAASLLSATPIAALDVRWPLMAQGFGATHVVEPIGQIVYRGTGTTAPGIVNNNAQSFVFDDTNLFSFDRFSGTDRQETGLRANYGLRYQALLADGGYVELVGGQSVHLAGPNAFAASDPSNVGLASGLDVSPSYGVLGAYGSFWPGVVLGGKLQIDPDALRVTRAGLGASFDYEGVRGRTDYIYEAAIPALGHTRDVHELGGQLSVPLADYWRATFGTRWDLVESDWLLATGGLAYDDGYLAFGVDASVNGPAHPSPFSQSVLASLRLKMPGQEGLGFTGVSVPRF